MRELVNTPPLDQALGELETWARHVLMRAGISTDIRRSHWYSDNRGLLGEPEVDERWLAWKALDAALLARQRHAEGDLEQAMVFATEAWRFAFWHEVRARRRTIERLRAASEKQHGSKAEQKERARQIVQAAVARGEKWGDAQREAAKELRVHERRIREYPGTTRPKKL